MSEPAITFVRYLREHGPDGDVWAEETVKLPAHNEVCPRCRGEGRHVNPAIDGNGITAEEMADLGPEFLEDYLDGVYDVACHECAGRRVVAVLDRDRCDPAILAEYDEDQREQALDRACERAERMAGA